MSPALEALKGVAPVGADAVLGRYHRDRVCLKGFAFEARVYMKNAFIKGRSGPKFLILCRARSGSTLLCRLLNQVPDIHCELEVLHHNVAFPRFFAHQLARKRKSRVYGFKILSYQMVLVQALKSPEDFFDSLYEDGFRFIHLTRNSLDQGISICSASSTGVYFKDRHGQRIDQVKIDPHEFVKRVRWNLALLKFEKSVLQNIPHEKVLYEQDLTNSDDHQKVIDRISKWLGVESGCVIAPMERTLPESLEDRILNFKEVKEVAVDNGLEEIF